jgi:hypothetical protein
MMAWNSVGWAVLGAAMPTLLRSFFVAIVRDFARRFALTIFGIRLFDRTIGRLLSDPLWSGRWRITWFVESQTFNDHSSWESRIYRCFDTIAAEGRGDVVEGTSIPYGFVGKLSRDKTILTGTWFDRRGTRAGYHGSYQLRMPASGAVAKGKWIGFSDTKPIVKSGELEWRRLEA